jgi:hypothetical protein
MHDFTAANRTDMQSLIRTYDTFILLISRKERVRNVTIRQQTGLEETVIAKQFTARHDTNHTRS